MDELFLFYSEFWLLDSDFFSQGPPARQNVHHNAQPADVCACRFKNTCYQKLLRKHKEYACPPNQKYNRGFRIST